MEIKYPFHTFEDRKTYFIFIERFNTEKLIRFGWTWKSVFHHTKRVKTSQEILCVCYLRTGFFPVNFAIGATCENLLQGSHSGTKATRASKRCRSVHYNLLFLLTSCCFITMVFNAYLVKILQYLVTNTSTIRVNKYVFVALCCFPEGVG